MFSLIKESKDTVYGAVEPGEDAERRIKEDAPEDATLLHAKDIQFPPGCVTKRYVLQNERSAW